MKLTVRRILTYLSLAILLICLALSLAGCGECDHHFVDETVKTEPTCQSNGVLTRRCDKCDETFTWIIDGGNQYHKLSTLSFVAPTCDKAGYETVICSTCNGTTSNLLPAIGHSYSVISSTNPTCTESGLVVSKCINCAGVNETVLAAKHTYTSATVTVTPTCQNEGKEEFNCTVCGLNGHNVLPKLEHTPVNTERVDPTCQATGITAGRMCEICNATISGRETVSIVEHSFGETACVWCNTPKTYTVSYVYTGSASVSFPEQTYSHGDIFVPHDASKIEDESNAFVGWFDENDTKYTTETVITKNVVLYPKFDSFIPVSDAAGLRAMLEEPDKHYVLTRNIDAEGIIWTPIENFGGTLDGRGFAIYNIILNTTEQKDFGFVRVNNGTIKDLTFKDFTFNATLTPVGTLSFGVIAGQNNGKISKVNVESGTVMLTTERSGANDSYSLSFGLIAGTNGENATVESCFGGVSSDFKLSTTNTEYNIYFAASIAGRFSLGGIVGKNLGTLSDSDYEGSLALNADAASAYGSYATDHYASNTVYIGSAVGENCGSVSRASGRADLTLTSTRNRGDASNHFYCGSFVGLNQLGGVIEHSYSAGSVYSSATNTNNSGGFIGLNSENSSVKSCYTTASVHTVGSTYSGGFVGSNSGIIQNSYAASEVFAEGSGRVGGFVGSLNSAGSVSKSYSAGDVTVDSGEAGRFLGFAEGTVLKCYFLDSSTVLSGGTYLPTVTEYNTVLGIVYTKLWNEDFLINEMYWEDFGWIVPVDENPLLAWEMEKGHNFLTTEIAPDCERGGFTIYNCTDCARIFIKNYVDPLGHELKSVTTIPATCGAEGYTLVKCERAGCSHENKTDIVEKQAHNNDSLNATYTLLPTCLTAGKIIYYCNDCKNGDIVVEYEPLGHSGVYVSTINAASCTSEGTDLYFCTRAGCGEYEHTTSALPHTPKAVDYLAPSCGRHIDGEGTVTYSPMDGRMPGEICSVCNTVLSGCQVIPAHSFTLSKALTAPDCLNEGVGLYVCAECEYSEQKPIAAKGHADNDLNNVCDVCVKFCFTSVPESLFVHISDVAGLLSVGNNLSGYYILDGDIDLSGIDWAPLGTADNPFKGVFFGNGHKISGLSFTVSDGEKTAVLGLFGYNRGTVVGLKLDSPSFTVSNTSCTVGGIVACNMGKVIGCSLTGESVFKLNLNLNVTDYKHHTLKSVMIAGGIVGTNDQTGEMFNCKSENHVSVVIESSTKISSPDAINTLIALIYDTKAETELNASFGAIAGKNEGLIDTCSVAERVSVTLAFDAELIYQKGNILAEFNVYAADIIGYNSGTATSCTGRGSAYCYAEGYNYKNLVDKFFKGKLYTITVTFVNHSEDSPYAGLFGGNEGTVN